MWEISITSQLTGFLYAVLLGSIYCLIYDVFRAVRLTGKSGALSVFIQDILFWIICFAGCFCFLLSVTNGEPRAYILIGASGGFLLFRSTLSRLFLPVFKISVLWLRKFYGTINRLTGSFFAKTESVLRLITNKTSGIYENGKKCFKKLLKKGRGLLYTNHNR